MEVFKVTCYRHNETPRIERVEIVKSTEKSVWIKRQWKEDDKGYRNARNSDGINFFDEKEEAISSFEELTLAVLEKAEKTVAGCKKNLEAIANHKALKDETD